MATAPVPLFLKIAQISKQAIKEINYFILFCIWVPPGPSLSKTSPSPALFQMGTNVVTPYSRRAVSSEDRYSSPDPIVRALRTAAPPKPHATGHRTPSSPSRASFPLRPRPHRTTRHRPPRRRAHQPGEAAVRAPMAPTRHRPGKAPARAPPQKIIYGECRCQYDL